MSPKKSDFPKLACGSKGMRGTVERLRAGRDGKAQRPARRIVALQAVEEGEELRASASVEPRELVTRAPTLPVVRKDGLGDGRRAAVVEQRGVRGEPPQRRGAHLPPAGCALRDAITQLAHVVQQEVRVGMEHFAV